MKKIDLHLHTVPTSSDASFAFSLEVLKGYVKQMEVDCIAITNHNIFDIGQYEILAEELTIPIFPGIELDVERCHLLLISDSIQVNDFASKCDQINALMANCSSITVEQLTEVFNDLSSYLIIPHYDKKPAISDKTLDKLKDFVHVGEVTSIRKFKSCLQEPNALVPVLFSDQRLHTNLENYSIRQTYIDLEEITFAGVRACLYDKAKVFLSGEDGNRMFQATEEGIKLSTGLNVIIGERSSGKTFTLNSILKHFEHVKYIEQFSLLQNNDQQFEKLLKVRQSSVSELFLHEFKKVSDEIVKIDLLQDQLDIDQYLSTLLKFAAEYDKEDAYSKAALFSEGLYIESNLDGLKKVIDATATLIDNIEYKDIIGAHVDETNLKSLILALIERLRGDTELNLKKRWLNGLITNIQSVLRSRTTSTYPEEIDLYRIASDIMKVNKFCEIVDLLKSDRVVDSKDIKGFTVLATTKRFTGASQLKEKSKSKSAYTEAYNHYDEPYKYLQKLKAIDTLEETDYYKYFIDIHYQTLNKHGFPVSGGERSEFNLLHEIDDALKHELLLIDEPESSFDNLFLRTEVNELIKDIAKQIPVILVTHNSTVGASIQPDYLLYTKKIVSASGVSYKVYSGHPSAKELLCPSGDTINNYDVMLDCLEAGDEAYKNRRIKSYEILRNQG